MAWLAVAFALGVLAVSLDVALGGAIFGRPAYAGTGEEEAAGD